jgi:hypothetical protein
MILRLRIHYRTLSGYTTLNIHNTQQLGCSLRVYSNEQPQQITKFEKSSFSSVFAVIEAKKINKCMKLNERKLIRQDLDRIARSMREELPAKNKAELVSAFDELKSKAKNVSDDRLSDWDKESLRLATEYVQEENRDEFRRAINRILELAGLSPEIEKHIYQRQKIERQKLNTQ